MEPVFFILTIWILKFLYVFYDLWDLLAVIIVCASFFLVYSVVNNQVFHKSSFAVSLKLGLHGFHRGSRAYLAETRVRSSRWKWDCSPGFPSFVLPLCSPSFWIRDRVPFHFQKTKLYSQLDSIRTIGASGIVVQVVKQNLCIENFKKQIF